MDGDDDDTVATRPAKKPTLSLPFLRSCFQECDKPVQGDQSGQIPKWLEGSLLRIGPGLLEVGPDKYNHWFDGLSLIHRFGFHDGKVTYQNRFLRSDAYKRNMRAKRIVTSEFATRGVPDPCQTIFQRFSSLFSMDRTDNDIVSITTFGNEAFACSETHSIWKLDTETLESLRKFDLRQYLPVSKTITHAHEDTDGTVYNIGTSYGLYTHYNILKFPPKDKKVDQEASPFDSGKVVCKIPISKAMSPSYYHSFAMTENYFVMVEPPLYMPTIRMAWAHFIAETYAKAMRWDPKEWSRFHVVRRSDGHLLETSYVANPFFAFHHINAYEEDNHLVIDLCGYESVDMFNSLYLKALEELFSGSVTQTQDPFCARARRYVLPLNVDKERSRNGENLVTLPKSKAAATISTDGSVFCDYEVFNDAWSPELPSINYKKVNGRKYRYFYAVGQNKTSNGTHLVKVDTETKKTTSWKEEGVIPSEPIFVPLPDQQNHQDEDSGVLLASLLYINDENKVSLLVLDCKTMTEVGRATFKTNSSIPSDFHGVFMPKT